MHSCSISKSNLKFSFTRNCYYYRVTTQECAGLVLCFSASLIIFHLVCYANCKIDKAHLDVLFLLFCAIAYVLQTTGN